MTTPLLDYVFGNLYGAIRATDQHIGRRLFATLLTQDRVFIESELKNWIESGQLSKCWKSRFRVAQAAMALAHDKIESYSFYLQYVDVAALNNDDDVWNNFYISTFNLLVNLAASPEFRQDRQTQPNPSAVLMGDSHVLGISAASDGSLQRFYMPGINLQTLAGSSHNAHKQALVNSHALAHSAEIINYSIGEADSRDLISHIARDFSYWYRKKSSWARMLALSFKLLDSLRNPIQQQNIVVPPHFSGDFVASKAEVLDLNQKEEFLYYLKIAQKEFCDIFVEQAQICGMVPLHYSVPENRKSEFRQPEQLLDQIHFKIPIYALLGRKMLT